MCFPASLDIIFCFNANACFHISFLVFILSSFYETYLWSVECLTRSQKVVWTIHDIYEKLQRASFKVLRTWKKLFMLMGLLLQNENPRNRFRLFKEKNESDLQSFSYYSWGKEVPRRHFHNFKRLFVFFP